MLQWIVFACALLALLGFSRWFVVSFSERSDTSDVTKYIGVTALFVALVTLFVLPVDVYSISSSTDETGHQLDPSAAAARGEQVRVIYYVLYVILALLVFGVLPFGFFYYEEDEGDGNNGLQALRALKYTVVFVLMLLVLIALGFLLRHGKIEDSEAWLRNLVRDVNSAEKALAFVVGIISMLGMTGWVSYSACGMALLPLKTMGINSPSYRRRSRNLTSPILDVEAELNRVRARIEYLQARYATAPNEEWSRQDQLEFARLQRRERQLTHSVSGQSRADASSSRDSHAESLSWLTGSLMRFRVAIGISFLLVSLFIAVTLLLSTIDRTLNSACGFTCGFVLETPYIFNPLDKLLLFLSKTFPLDYLVFAALVLYMFVCTMTGLVNIGVRALCIKLYNIRRGRTMQNALLMGIWFLCFVLLAINVQMMTMAPQYSAFGSQQYLRDGVLKPCKLDQSSGGSDIQCVVSQLVRFQITIAAETPALCFVQYLCVPLFLIVFICCLFASAFRKAPADEPAYEYLSSRSRNRLDYLVM